MQKKKKSGVGVQKQVYQSKGNKTVFLCPALMSLFFRAFDPR